MYKHYVLTSNHEEVATMFKIYRNLNISKQSDNRWSIYKGDKLSHAIAIHSYNVTIKQPSGKKFIECLNGGKRSVFAWFKSDNISADIPAIPSKAKQVNFNPKKGDKYFHMQGEQVDYLTQVWLTKDGQCFGIK